MEKQWKVLLIDDDPGIRKVMGISLEDAGYRVFTAPDGEAGIAQCVQESPEIVIVDVRMPGIDGIQELQRIKELDPDKEVIVATAFSELNHAIRALQLDASDFITKPIQDDALMIALKRAKERFSTRKDIRDYTALIEEKWLCTAEELAKTFDFQRLLIESSIDGIAACDEKGRIIVFNRSMEHMLGYRRDDAVGKMALDQLFARGAAEKFRLALSSGEFGGEDRLFLYETFLACREGTRIPVQLSAAVMFHESEKRGIVGFFRDQREIRKLTQQAAEQARLLHQDKMISLGKLAASVVHEINNPLTGILNYARLMTKILGCGELPAGSVQKFQGYLTLMESELSRCSKIVSSLLAFSRKSRVEFGEVDVNDLLSKCITLSQHKLILQNIRIVSDLESGLPAVSGDFNQLQQCVINLIFNAIDAMPRGGVLTLASAFDPNKKVAHIQVSDTGCGIPKEDLPYIFDPFFTTKTEGQGLGLGLSTTYGIIDWHRGSIQVQSEPGKGTVFTVELPVR
jgi:two-component system, NtrC family, sensor kinase